MIIEYENDEWIRRNVMHYNYFFVNIDRSVSYSSLSAVSSLAYYHFFLHVLFHHRFYLLTFSSVFDPALLSSTIK